MWNYWVKRQKRYEIFVVIVRKPNIGFFEYHADVTNQDEDKIDNFRGAISLTRSYKSNSEEGSSLDLMRNVLSSEFDTSKLLGRIWEQRYRVLLLSRLGSGSYDNYDTRGHEGVGIRGMHRYVVYHDI